MGRPTDCTPEVTASVCRHIRRGVTYEDAARCSGISGTSFREWMARGRDGDEPYATFAAAVEKAKAAGKSARLARIEKAGKTGAWQADAWWLERVYPAEFGRRVVEHTGGGGGPVQVDVRTAVRAALRDLPDEEVLPSDVVPK